MNISNDEAELNFFFHDMSELIEAEGRPTDGERQEQREQQEQQDVSNISEIYGWLQQRGEDLDERAGRKQMNGKDNNVLIVKKKQQ